MVKLAIVSHSCIKRINRSVYYNLAEVNNQLQLFFITPKEIRKGNVIIASEREQNPEHRLIKLEQLGDGLRTFTLNNLIETLNEIKPDIVLLENDPVSRIAMQASKWTRQNRKKIYCLTNDNFTRNIRESFKRGGIKTVLQDQVINKQHKRISKYIDGLFVINKEGKEIFTKKGYADKVIQIPLGYNEKYFYPKHNAQLAFKKKNNISSETTIISYFGRIVEEKGIHLLIDELEKLKNENWFFMIDSFEANGAYQENIIKRLNSQAFEDKVLKFEAEHGEIAKYMQVTDITVAPSLCTPQYREQYGRVIPEAMACGSAVIASNSGQLPDLVGDAGMVFENGNALALSEKILFLLQNKEYLNKLKEKAANRAKLFSLVEQTKILNQYIFNVNNINQV